MDYTYQENFQYKHRNPYHDRLAGFEDFVLRDHEAEEKKGQWSSEVFKREAPLEVEIGSGFGYFMRDYCSQNPHVNFLGMDIRFKRSYTLAKNLAKLDTANFRYLRGRGERIGFIFDENEVDKIHYYFPDPWPKARHQKKRLFQRPFLEAAHRTLKQNGRLMIKTDHQGYAEWMKEAIDNATDLFELKFHSFDLYQEADDHFLAQFQTKFEKIFLGKGIPIKAFELAPIKDDNGKSGRS